MVCPDTICKFWAGNIYFLSLETHFLMWLDHVNM